MDITFENKTLNGKISAKPVYEDLKRYLICSLFINETSTIKNVLLNKETKDLLNILSKLGATITVDEYDGKRKTLKIKGSYPFDVNISQLDLRNNADLLKTIAPILLVSQKKFNIKYQNILISNPIHSFYSFFFKRGFTKTQKEKREYPIKIKTGIDKSVFFIRADVEKEYLSTLLSIIPRAYNNAKIIIHSGELKDKDYILKTIKILESFNVKIVNHDFKEFDIINTKYLPCDIKIENDFTSASVWITASALGHKIMVKNLNLKSEQKNKKILDILKIIGFNILVNKQGDIIAKPNKINAFNIDITKVPDLLPYLSVIASVADGTSKLRHADEIYINNTPLAEEMSRAINEIGGDSFVFGGDLIIRGREILKGGEIKEPVPHEIVFALCAISRQCKNPIKVTLPNSKPRYYKEFYRDYKRLVGRRYL